MSRWLLVLAVTVASATASAESRQPTTTAQLTAATTMAESATKSAERRVAQLTEYRAALAKRYKEELDAIDRLKNQRASWRRDRELRGNLSDSAETANQLSAATRELDKARTGLDSARRSYLSAVEAELTAGASSSRTEQLTQVKAQLTSQVKDVPHRIVIPDFDVDPLADPEEIDQRASELRSTEGELVHQIDELGARATELDHLVQLRKQHERAGELFNRDDDQPHHSTAKPSTDGEDGGSHLPNVGGGPSINFDNFVPIVLADVIDATTINSFAAAQRSGDPSQRAEAAHRTHDAVVQRLEQVRKRRVELESRARTLRSAH